MWSEGTGFLIHISIVFIIVLYLSRNKVCNALEEKKKLQEELGVKS